MSIIQVCNWTSSVINNDGCFGGISMKEKMHPAPQHDGGQMGYICLVSYMCYTVWVHLYGLSQSMNDSF